jgi:hypothetical protein
VRHFLLFFACLLSLKSFSQVKDQACDTCSRVEMAQDSIKNALKEDIKNRENSLSKDLFKKKEEFKFSAPALDSNSKEKGKSQIKGLLNKQTDAVKQKKDGLWTRAKSQLPKKENIFKFGVNIRSDNYATTEQNPLMRNEKIYSRLYVSPTFTVLGLPFTSNFFFTTEANNTYKNNFFAIRFDVNAMRQKAAEQIQKELDEAKKVDRLRQIDLKKNGLETNRLEKELDRLKKDIPDYDNWQDALKSEAENQAKQKIDDERLKYEEKVKNVGEEEKIRLQKAYELRKDSIVNGYKKSINDSLNNLEGKASKIDTSKMRRVLELQAKLDQLNSKKEELEQLRQMDSMGLTKKLGNHRDPNELKEMMKSQLPGKGILTSVLSVDRMGIGLVNPNYSDFTLNSVSVKGVDIGVSKKSYFYDFTFGKTTRQFIGPFSSTNIEFNRNIGVVRLGVGQRKADHVSVEYLYAYDRSLTDSFSPLIRNGVLNVNGKLTLLKNTVIEADWAQSRFKESYIKSREVNFNQSKPILNANANMAYQLKATQTFGELIKFESQLRQTGAAFRTVGNPFLRRNFREVELKYEQKLFKKQIVISGNYKEMRDNLVEINSSTNRLKGYGLKLSTHFKKLPNIVLSHSPYQQGNNHPDSLYRTNNQFSITTAVLTYKKRFKRVNWVGLVNYTRSAMEIGVNTPVAYEMMSSIHTFQIGQRHTSMLVYLRNTTAPFVDSLNSSSVQLSHNFIAKKGLILGCMSEYTVYKNEAFKLGGGLTINKNLIKNLSVNIAGRYDRINGIWNLQNADVLSGRMVVQWRF